MNGSIRTTGMVGVVAAMAVLAGCYHYVPTTAEHLVPRTDIRARITAGEAERLESLLMRPDLRVLEGVFVERRDGSLLVQVPVMTELRGIRMETLHQRIDVSLSSVMELERREIDRRRTALVLGGGTVLLLAVVINQFRDTGASERDGPGEPPAELRRPFRIPISIGW